MTQEPYQQIYEKYFIQKLFTQMCSLCTKAAESCFLSPPSLRDVSTLGPLPGLCHKFWGCLWAAASEGGAFSTTVSYATAKKPYSQVPPPSRVDRHPLSLPSLLQTPQAHSKSLVLPLAAGFSRTDQPCKPWTFLPSPTSSIVSKVGDREARERRLGPDGGNGIRGQGNEEHECGQHYT